MEAATFSQAGAGTGLRRSPGHVSRALGAATAATRLSAGGRRHAQTREISKEESLEGRHQEILRAASRGLPHTLVLPRKPILATAGALGGMIGRVGGWFETAFSSALTSQATAQTLRGLNAAPSEELLKATQSLETLQKTLFKKKPNRMHLIGALSTSIESLSKLLDADDLNFTFRFPVEPDDEGLVSQELIEQLLQKIRYEIELLSQYKGYLEGFREVNSEKIKLSIFKDDLRALRLQVMHSLFTPDEARRHQYRQRPNQPPQGLLAIFLYFKDAQQGILNALLHDTTTTTIEIVRSALEDSIGLSRGASEEIDTPKYERILEENGNTKIQANYTEDGGTLGGLIEACFDLFKRGDVSGIIRSTCIALLVSLKQVEIFLSNDGKDLLSETESSDVLETHPVIESLRSAIHLLEQAKQPGKTLADLKSAVFQTKELLSKHSIWFGSVINLGLPGPKAHEPVSKSLLTIQEFEKRNPCLQKKENHSYAKDAETLASEVAEIGSYQAAFQGIFNYFIKERGSWIQPKDKPVFANLMQNVMRAFPRPSQVIERRSMMIQEFRSYIRKATDIFFLKRWALQIFTPQIVWLSEYCVVNLKDGAFKGLKEFINNAKSNQTGDVSIEPIERLKSAIDHLFLARKSYAEGHAINADQAVKMHCATDEDFLESRETGCKTLLETYTKIGDSAVDRFLGLFEPTAKINRATEEISAWASESIFLRLSVFPITGFLTLVNYVFIFPVEFVVNKITHPFVKMILKSTDAIGMAHKLLGDSMFPKDTKGRHTTKVMNQIIVNLLHKLSQLLQEPSDPNDEGQTFEISKASQTALSGTIKSILKLLAIQPVDCPDDLKRFDQSSESSGLSPLLAEAIRLLIGEDEKDLDTKVADAAKELLARCYYLLMDEEILNQQIVLALTSVKEGMLSQVTEELDADESEIDYEKVIQELKTIVIQQAAHLAHAPISKGEIRDKALRAHIENLKKTFLGNSETGEEGLIQKWRASLQHPDRSPATMKTLYKEAKQASQNLLNDILKLKAQVKSGQVGAESYEIHLRNLIELQETISSFSTSFLDTYNLIVLQSLPRKDQLCSDMQAILAQIKKLEKQTSTDTLESLLEQIKESLATFSLRFEERSCSEEIKEFILACEKIVYRSGLVTERSEVTTFIKATEKLKNLENEITTTAVTNRNVLKLNGIFKSYDRIFSGLEEAQEIKRLEKAILETITNAMTTEDARATSLEHYKELCSLLSRTEKRLCDSYNGKFTDIAQNVAQIEAKTAHLFAEFSPSDGAAEGDGSLPPAAPPERKTLAFYEEELLKNLKTLESAAAHLETVSSLNIPLDKIPFFKTTEAAIVSLLQDRITSIEEVLFKNRNALMAIIIKQELAFLNPITPETTSL